MRKRVLSLFTIIIFLFLILIGRLGFIQIIKAGEYRQISKNQYLSNVDGVYVRGTIFDRNNRPLTDTEESFFIWVEKRKVNAGIEKLLEKINAYPVENNSERYAMYSTADMGKTTLSTLLKDHGAFVVKYNRRYAKDQPAMHLVGCVDEEKNRGLWGIEMDYDEALSSKKTPFMTLCDGHGYIIPGEGVNVENDGRIWGVITTLDLEIQRIVEEVFGRYKEKGAAIVTDIKTGEILASVSYPYFDYETVSSGKEEDESFINKAISNAYKSGSIFDVIVFAAEKEKEDVTNMVRALGLSEEAITELSGQCKGNLPEFERKILDAEIDISQGYEELKVTPVQVARMTRLIANEGLDSKLKLIRGTQEGVRGAFLHPKQRGQQVISMETARAMGKVLNDANMTGWYTDYLPKEDPLYGITVYIENDRSYSSYAKILFKEIADKIKRI